MPRKQSVGNGMKGAPRPRDLAPKPRVGRTPAWDAADRDVYALWLLRAIVWSGKDRTIFGHTDDDSGLLPLLGLEHLKSGAARERIRRDAAARLADLEALPPRRGTLVMRNVEALGDLVGLSRVERDVVGLALALEAFPEAQHCFYGKESGAMRALLARVLGADEAELRRSLSLSGALWEMGLVELSEQSSRGERSPTGDRGWPFVVMEGLYVMVRDEYEPPRTILDNFFGESAPAKLSMEDFPHAERDVDIVRRLLRRAIEQGARGVNVLLHGLPGTGKTELVRVVAREIGATLYEVGAETLGGEPVGRLERFSSFQVCQRMLAPKGGSLVIFDEIEDVFPEMARGPFEGRRVSGEDKGWTNRLLEGNHVPAVWVSNRIEQLDPAFLRRFDFIMELRTPPFAVRRRILAASLAGLQVSAGWIDRAALDERLTPAHADRAARAAKLIAYDGAIETEACLARLVENSLAMSADTTLGRAPHSAGAYDLGMLNASEDVGSLADAIVRRSGSGKPTRGSICLYGAPGTGKTAFAHHLAERLGRPLLVRRASDLLGPFVGQTEKSIARAFRQASGDGSVLLIDEADSFFQSRRSAAQHWEISQVNELLVQVEAFDGLLVCSTNLFENLDEAAMRRFTVKVRFDALRPEQRMEMFRRTLTELGASGSNDDPSAWWPALLRLTTLTPGDFATVRRKVMLLGSDFDGGSLLAALERECAAKPGARKGAMGFGS